jgi:hypothetical protein
MQENEVFILADRALEAVVQRIRDEQWPMVMPANFLTRQLDHPPTLHEVVSYHAYEDAWVPDMLAGRTMAEVGQDAYKGDLLGNNPKGNFSALVDKACAAAQALDDLTRTVHTSFGDFPAREYLWQTNLFRGLRAHDIARVLGVDAHLSAGLVEALWEEISPHAEEWRTIGVFPAAIPVSEDAPLLSRLLGLTGRQP